MIPEKTLLNPTTTANGIVASPNSGQSVKLQESLAAAGIPSQKPASPVSDKTVSVNSNLPVQNSAAKALVPNSATKAGSLQTNSNAGQNLNQNLAQNVAGSSPQPEKVSKSLQEIDNTAQNSSSTTEHSVLPAEVLIEEDPHMLKGADPRDFNGLNTFDQPISSNPDNPTLNLNLQNGNGLAITQPIPNSLDPTGILFPSDLNSALTNPAISKSGLGFPRYYMDMMNSLAARWNLGKR
jgi:hypothetical protein